MGLKVLQRKRVPRFSITGDGLPGDPINVVLIGTLPQLQAAFATAGWSVADRLNAASSWRMVRAFVFKSPYPTAPFSTLYLYGRGQDIGFQKAIDNSPRKRHHIRFWALSSGARRGHAGRRRLLAEHRPSTGRCPRPLGRRRHQRHRLLPDQSHFSDYARNRLGHQCRAGLHHCRVAELSRHRERESVSFRPAFPGRARQPLRHRRRSDGGEPVGGFSVAAGIRPGPQVRASPAVPARSPDKAGQ